jgi:hypothetical protein
VTSVTGSRCRRSPARSAAVTAAGEDGRDGDLDREERHATAAAAVTAARAARRPPWPAVAAWGLWGLGTLAFLVAAWLGQLIRAAGRPDLAQLTVRDTLPLLLASVSAATVGAVLVSRRPRHPVGWLLLGLGVSMITIGAVGDWATALVAHLAILVAAGSLVVRFRRARGVERLQLRWVAVAAVLAGVAALGVVAGTVTGTEALWLWATAAYIVVLPLAIGASILRYRLYDLDRILSRTLAWTLLTVVLGLGYAAVVLLLGRLVPDGSSLAVAGATLAVAAIFQPARRRIQQVVDRRFNRHRYDAARTIQAFSGRLRQQVDLDSLRAELLAVADQTMQPTTMSLWLRPRS